MKMHMAMISVSFFFVLLNFLVPVYSQTCIGTAIHNPCSSNEACGCIPMVAADDFGLCGFLWLTCSRLESCKGTDDHCEKSDHVCVRHPQCQNQPVCYPLQMIDQRICPPPNNIPVNNTTPVITTTDTTTIETTVTATDTTTIETTVTPTETTVTTTETTTTTTIQTTTTSPASERPAGNICARATWARQGMTVAGNTSSGATNNRLSYPEGIFVGESQTVYVADTKNNRVMKWKKNATTGELVAGHGGRGTNNSQLINPLDITVDQDETVYIVDSGNSRIQKWYRNGFRAGTILNILSPTGVALDNEGTLYVAGSSSGYLYQQRKEATNWVSIGNNVTGLQYITANKNQSIIGVSLYYKQVLIKYKNNTKFFYIADGSKEFFLNPSFDPYAAIVDQSDYVYVLEKTTHRVTRWSPGATTGTVIVGGNGSGAAADQLNSPSDIAFDEEGNIYIADTNNHRVQKFLIDNSSCN